MLLLLLVSQPLLHSHTAVRLVCAMPRAFCHDVSQRWCVQDAKLKESNVGDALSELREYFEKALKDDAAKLASGIVQRAAENVNSHAMDESEFQREFKSADVGWSKVCIKSSPRQKAICASVAEHARSRLTN
jgi:hypothetical protein